MSRKEFRQLEGQPESRVGQHRTCAHPQPGVGQDCHSSGSMTVMVAGGSSSALPELTAATQTEGFL